MILTSDTFECVRFSRVSLPRSVAEEQKAQDVQWEAGFSQCVSGACFPAVSCTETDPSPAGFGCFLSGG